MKTPLKSKPKKNTNVAKYHGVTLPSDTAERRRVRNKLSAQVHRKRKQDALKTAREEVESCDAEINRLKMQLNDTRAQIASLQASVGAIQAEFGPDAVREIYDLCGLQVEGIRSFSGVISSSSDSETNMSSSHSVSSSSDDDLSLGCIKDMHAEM